MGFAVLVAGDIRGKTYNFEYTFPTLPTLTELIQQVEEVFTKELSDVITVAKMQVYDAVSEKWSDLNSGRQLKDGCQVYIFPAGEKKLVTATPRGKPPMVHPQPPSTPGPTSLVSHDNTSLTSHDPVRVTFDFLDTNRCRKVAFTNLSDGLHAVRLGLSPAIVESLFRKADCNGDGVVTFAEWQRLSDHHPKLVDTLFTRIDENKKESEMAATFSRLKGDLERLHELHIEKEAVHRGTVEAFETQQLRVESGTHEVRGCEAREIEAIEAHKAVLSELDIVDTELRDAEANEAHARKREEDLANQVSLQLEMVETASRNVTQEDTDVAAAKDRIRQLEYELEEARRTLTQKENSRNTALTELLSAQDNEAATRVNLNQAQLDTQNTHDTVVKIEYAMSRLHDAIRSAASGERDAIHMTKQGMQNKEMEMKELRKIDERVRAASDEEVEAGMRLKQKIQEVTALNNDMNRLAERSYQTAEHEVKIIEEEVRLRESRNSLEEQEARLGALHGRYRANRDREHPAMIEDVPGSSIREREGSHHHHHNTTLNVSNISAVGEHLSAIPSPMSTAGPSSARLSPGHAVRGLAAAINQAQGMRY
eukprot:TRINITY_DN18396_c0_g1_i1.p1 TRINITY_DN18396_c0_g1~~TRINITY_DN18396_c0_g1_i1.p1  ORF type:complete len:596 (+),score=189.26 TRINITY_DN18396_c0_g1_i1:105-1892(+)